MTEAQWLKSRSAARMLAHLGRTFSGRKARLFACAVTRLLTPDDPQTREQLRLAIETAEASADGADVQKAMRRGWRHSWNVCDPDAFASALGAAKDAMLRRRQPTIATLLRCVAGNPFRPGTVSPAVLAWDDHTLPKLAQAVYEERAFDRLPILADALEDAGGDEAMIAHLRSPGPHARGCWVVDLLLGKT
jgi:hypothetical protein